MLQLLPIDGLHQSGWAEPEGVCEVRGSKIEKDCKKFLEEEVHNQFRFLITDEASFAYPTRVEHNTVRIFPGKRDHGFYLIWICLEVARHQDKVAASGLINRI